MSFPRFQTPPVNIKCSPTAIAANPYIKAQSLSSHPPMFSTLVKIISQIIKNMKLLRSMKVADIKKAPRKAKAAFVFITNKSHK